MRKWVQATWNVKKYLAHYSSGQSVMVDLLTSKQRAAILKTGLVKISEIGGMLIWKKV
jgi:hypothetical protein